MRENQKLFTDMHVTGELVFTRGCKRVFTPGCVSDGAHVTVTVHLGLSAATGVFFLLDRSKNAVLEARGQNFRKL